MGLLYLLLGLREKWKLKLGLLHLNHGLRGRESVRDVRFVKGLARKYRFPLYHARRAVLKMAGREDFSLEEAARKARYDFFLKTAGRRRISKIASAHTRDDQAETVLMRVLQGTGLRGLEGIRPRVKMGPVTFVRPLLEFSKKEVLAFLRHGQIPFCKDASNQSPAFLRNRIRLKLLPELARAFNPRIVETLARIPRIVREENEILAVLERAAWKRAVRRQTSRKLFLDRKAFLKFPPALQFRVLERGLRQLDGKSGLSFDAWQGILPHLSRKRYRRSLPKDIDLDLTPLKLLLYKKFPRR